MLHLDGAGRVLRANAAWQDLATTAPAISGPPALFPLIDPSNCPAVRAAFVAAIERRVAIQVHCRVLLAAPRDVTVVFVPEAGDVVLAMLLDREISSQALEIDMLRRQLAGLMDISSEAIMMVDRHMTITAVNRGAEAIFGYRVEEMIGRHVETLMPERYRGNHPGHVAGFAAGSQTSRLMAERTAVFGLRKSGEEFPAEASITRTGAGDGTSYSVILRDVTQRRRSDAELFAAKRAAEAANLAKSQFLATMSHELRTPLNAIIGFAEIIAGRLFGDDPERYATYAADIRGSGQHLLSIIDEILDLSRIEVGNEKLDFEWVQPAVLIAESLLLVRHRAVNNGVSLATEIAPDTPSAMMDRRRMRQVILNLLSNAIKFTGSGGRVQVAARPIPGGLEISVSDNGIGIPPEHLARVFEPFHQVAAHRARNPEGTGLGLSIARRICESHGGRLVAESTVGEGTCMRVLLPVREAAIAPGAAATS
jgi:PAS domain S-box-containing protein